MERRKFLKIGGIAAAAAGVPTTALNVNRVMSSIVKSIIKRELHYLRIDPKGLERFSDDYVNFLNKFPLLSNQKFRMNIAGNYMIYNHAQNSTTIKGIVNRFLFSSDFFINQMDESKTVNYLGMQGLSKAVCFNPFSHLYYPHRG